MTGDWGGVTSWGGGVFASKGLVKPDDPILKGSEVGIARLRFKSQSQRWPAGQGV